METVWRPADRKGCEELLHRAGGSGVDGGLVLEVERSVAERVERPVVHRGRGSQAYSGAMSAMKKRRSADPTVRRRPRPGGVDASLLTPGPHLGYTQTSTSRTSTGPSASKKHCSQPSCTDTSPHESPSSRTPTADRHPSLPEHNPTNRTASSSVEGRRIGLGGRDSSVSVAAGLSSMCEARPRCRGGRWGRRRSSARRVGMGTAAWTATASTPRTSPPFGPAAGGADEHAAVGVLDELDEARRCRPCGSSRGPSWAPGWSRPGRRSPASWACSWVQADRADLGVGEGHPGQGVVVGGLGRGPRRGSTGRRSAPGTSRRG